MSILSRVARVIPRLLAVALACNVIPPAEAVVRDGGIDPANLGQGGWLYLLHDATNHLSPNNISAVTNENSLLQYLKGHGLSYVIVKAGTSNQVYYDSSYSTTSPVFTSKLVNLAHTNGLKIFGSNRSWGNDIAGEIKIAQFVLTNGADGFIYDAEGEWESGNAWITNGPAQAWWLCSAVRSNWPTKFIAYNPFDTIYLHSTFPYKEFGYWCDAVMPQVYHHAATKGNAIAAIHWMDVNYRTFQNSLYSLPVGNSNGVTVYWTNAIKPVTMMRDVYGANYSTPYPPSDVRNFMDYLVADPNCVTAGGYQGSDYFRSELYDLNQWAYIKAATIGVFSNVVNSIIMDDARITLVGSWTAVKTIDATTGGTVSFTGEFGTDTNSFGTNYFKAYQGTGAGYMQFTPNILTGGDYLCYQWHPYRADASASVPHIIAYNGGTTTIYANQQTNAGDWSLLGQFNLAAGTAGYIRVTDGIPESGGVAMVDGLKLVFVPPTSVPAPPSGLSATAISISEIDLAWTDNATNETTYIVARSTAAGGPYTNIAFLARNSTNYSNTGLAQATTYYYVVWATNYLGASLASAEASATTIGAATPPNITSQPQDQTIAQGASASFSVTATGTAPLSYQWRWYGTNLTGATASSYTRTNVQPADAGSYSAVVTNAQGPAISSNALLTVIVPPTITTQPVSQTVTQGLSVTFTVAASGTAPFSYQWRLNGATISGATFTSYTRSNLQLTDAGSYSVVVTNTAGSATSSNAVLIVAAAPSITTQPQSQTITESNTVAFTVSASGTPPLSYQWRFYGTNLAGATATSLTLPGLSTNQSGPYTAFVTNAYGAATSQVAMLTVIPIFQAGGLTQLWSLAPFSRPYLTTNQLPYERGLTYNPATGHILLVSRTSPSVYVLDAATGADVNQLSVSGVSGGTYPLLMMGVADDGVVYAGNLTAGSSSTPFTLYRWANDSSNTVPTVAYSGNPTSGNSQRYGDTFDVRGAGTSTQVIIGSRSSTNVVILTTADGSTFTAKNIVVPDAPAGSFGLGIAFGTNNTFWGKAYNMALRQVSYDLTAGTGSSLRVYADPAFPNAVAPIAASTSLNLLAGISVSTTSNRLGLYDLAPLSTNGAPAFIASNPFPGTNDDTYTGSGAADFGPTTIYALCPNNGIIALQILPAVVNTAPVITSQPQPPVLTVTAGQTAVFTISATGIPAPSYQWRFNGTNVAGATTTMLAISNAQPADADSYSVLVTNIVGSVISSNSILIVNVPPAVTTQPQNQTVDQGARTTFFVAATGSEPLSFQWQLNGNPISGATLSSYTLASAQTNDAGLYAVVITNMAGSAASSNATLTVNVPPSITTQPQSLSVTAGSNALFTVTATGTMPLGYQWRFNGTNLASATGSAYTCNDAQAKDAGSYSVVVSNIAGALASDDAVLIVTQPAPPWIDSISLLSNGQIQFQVSGDPGQYAVEASTNLGDWAELSNFTNTGSSFQYLDSDTNQTRRYYRVRQMR